MFSHQIFNPKKFIINNNNFYAIPFGHRCSSALACRFANIRKFALPFDWTYLSFPKKIQKVLENNFTNFIPDVKNNIFINEYGFELAHFNSDIEVGIDQYERRIERFKTIMNESKKLYFIYINEDYLFDKNFRDDIFNDNIFNEMLELESYLKIKYKDIDYNILYFDFRDHDIPYDSNIINISLYAENYYDNPHDSNYDLFRIYCGEILSELFKTPKTIDII